MVEKIRIRKPSKEELTEMDVENWPIWDKEPSVFDWSYDSRETCYILEGSAVVIPSSGDPVEIGRGDLVVFPEGMDCRWEIRDEIRKHYKFG